jgi:hypothetical protein
MILHSKASVGNQSSALFAEDPSFTTNLKISPEINDEVGLFLGGSVGIYRERRSSGAPLFRQISPQVKMYGGYLGTGFEGFTLMAEYDLADGYLANEIKSSFVEASYNIVQGSDVIRWIDLI